MFLVLGPWHALSASSLRSELLHPIVPWSRLQLQCSAPGPLASEFPALLGGQCVAATNSGLSICVFFLSLFSSSPPCLLASLFFLASLFPSLPDHPIFPLLVPGGSPGEDLERNDGSQERPYFMSPELRDILLKGSAEEGKRVEVEE